MAALAQVQQTQERWRANQPSYTSTLSNLQLNLDAESKTSSGYYIVSIADGANASSYTATARAVSGTSQSHDTNCTVMRVRQVGAATSNMAAALAVRSRMVH